MESTYLLSYTLLIFSDSISEKNCQFLNVPRANVANCTVKEAAAVKNLAEEAMTSSNAQAGSAGQDLEFHHTPKLSTKFRETATASNEKQKKIPPDTLATPSSDTKSTNITPNFTVVQPSSKNSQPQQAGLNKITECFSRIMMMPFNDFLYKSKDYFLNYISLRTGYHTWQT